MAIVTNRFRGSTTRAAAKSLAVLPTRDRPDSYTVAPTMDSRPDAPLDAPLDAPDATVSRHASSRIEDEAAESIAHHRSAERFRDLIASAPVGQAVYSLGGTLIEVNQAWASLLGYEVDEVLGTPAARYVHLDDRAHVIDRAPALIKGEIDHLFEERRLVRRDGTSVWVSSTITVERDSQGRAALFHSLIIDINERKLAEGALRESEARYRAVIDSMHDGLVVFGAGEVLTANASAARILRLVPEHLTFEALAALEVVDENGDPMPLDDRPAGVAYRSGEPIYDLIQGIDDEAGERRWFLTNAVPLFHEDDGSPYAVALSFTDVTERKVAEDALRANETRFRTLAESLSVGVFQADSDGAITYANPRWTEITDIGLDQVSDPATVKIIHPDDRGRLLDDLTTAFREHRPYNVRYRIRARDGTTRWLSGHGARIHDPDTGAPTGIVGSIEDVTPLMVAQEQTTRLANIVESTSDLVAIVDWTSGLLVYLNRSARELFGYVGSSISEIHHLALFTDDARAILRDGLEPTLRSGEVWSGELPMKAADGTTVLVWQTIAADRHPDGTIYQVSAVGRDVTARRRFELDLAWQATHDPHTGLPNRALLLDHLELGLARAGRDERLVALYFLDLDRFKQVNDTLGHEAGDLLLKQAAERITAVLRPSDTVARIGGDEFVVLAEDVESEQHAIEIGQRVADSIDSAAFDLGDRVFEITASIGIAISRGQDAHPESLLRDADAAMYRAKDLGRARLEVFDETMREQAERRHDLANQLAIGIEQDAITVYYQPCVDLVTGEIRAVEALARWTHPDRGVLSPYDFIGLAEDTGLIVGLGLTVLSKACHQARQWEEIYGPGAPDVHVNLSARQLTAQNLPTLVEGVLAGTGLDPSRLCLEITESVLMDDAASAIDTLWALKAIGVSLAIDDFGTGYSSLSYLRRFPVDVLKVDQSFVAGLGRDSEDAAIVAAILNLAASLELSAIAEGVENEEQLQHLRELGCAAAQGFWFAEPGPAEAIEPLFGMAFPI